MQNFVIYSGIIVVVSAILLLVTPLLVFKKRFRLTSISQTVKVPIYGQLINIGIIISGVFQLLYAYMLSNEFLSLSSVVGGIFLGISSLFFLLCAVFDEIKHYDLHKTFILLYTVFLYIGLLLITYSYRNIYTYISYMNIAILGLGIFSVGLISLIKRNTLLSEMIVIFSTSLWAIITQSIINFV